MPVFERIVRKRDMRSGGGKYGCGKRQFSSYKSAKNMLRRGWQRTTGRLAPYFCNDCHHWHLGNSDNFRRAA